MHFLHTLLSEAMLEVLEYKLVACSKSVSRGVSNRPPSKLREACAKNVIISGLSYLLCGCMACIVLVACVCLEIHYNTL